jgi:hypothetical protein
MRFVCAVWSFAVVVGLAAAGCGKVESSALSAFYCPKGGSGPVTCKGADQSSLSLDCPASENGVCRAVHDSTATVFYCPKSNGAGPVTCRSADSSNSVVVHLE